MLIPILRDRMSANDGGWARRLMADMDVLFGKRLKYWYQREYRCV